MVAAPAGDGVIGSANFRDHKLPPDAPVGAGTEGTKSGNMTTTR